MTAASSARLGALVERERRTRFAGGAIGHFWAYLTPIAWIASVVVLFWSLNRNPPIYVAPEIFVATGILPYLAFRQTITSLSRTIPANRALLYLRPIKAHDLLLATALREAINLATTAGIIFAGISILYDVPFPAHPEKVVLGLALAWGLACGLGRLFAVLALVSDSFARIVPILLRPVFWLSGIFYTAAELPGRVQDILWYSPILHITEITREGYFLGYQSPIANAWMPLAVAAGFYVVAGPLERYVMVRKKARYRL